MAPISARLSWNMLADLKGRSFCQLERPIRFGRREQWRLFSSTVSANVQLSGGGELVLITNPTTSLAYVRFGSDPTVQATTADTPVLPNSKLLLRCGPLVSYCASIFGSGTGSVYIHERRRIEELLPR